jgi:hypothetical protein
VVRDRCIFLNARKPAPVSKESPKVQKVLVIIWDFIDFILIMVQVKK